MFLSGQIGGAVYFCKSAEIKKMNKFLNSGERKHHREQYLLSAKVSSNEELEKSEDKVQEVQVKQARKNSEIDKKSELRNARAEVKQQLRQQGLSNEDISMLKLRLRKIKRAE